MNKKYDHTKIIECYLSGKNQIQTADVFGTSAQYVYLILKNNNVAIRPVDNIGPKNPNWRGGVMYDHGRKLIYSPNHPNPDFSKKYCYEYRLIIEKIIGRFLKKSEVVHHIDRDITNNKISNLSVMTQKNHAKLHATEDKEKHIKFYSTCENSKRDIKGRFEKSPTTI